jgi:hypothetical protein
MTAGIVNSWGRRVLWSALIVLSAYYLYRAINYRFLTPSRLGPDLFNKQIWYFTHLIAALTAIYLGGVVGEYDGSKLPLVLLGSLWLSWIPLLKAKSAR